MPLDILIEGALFYKAAPLKKSALAKLLGVSEEELLVGIKELQRRLEHSALCLIETDSEIALATGHELSAFIESLRKEELKGDVGKAGAETLAIILYCGPITRSDIDRIRGVNSTFILRNLQARGLIERQPGLHAQSHRYVITTDLLAQLGITTPHNLPQFAEYMNALETFSATEHTSL